MAASDSNVPLKRMKQLDLNSDRNDSSDDELSEKEKEYSFTIFSRDKKIPAIATTIACCDKNIKGNTLIQSVHECVQVWADEAIDYACEPEKDNGGYPMIPPPHTEDLSLSINEPREWFMSFGGWKGMMPEQEVKKYFFFQFEPSLENKKFKSVTIFGNGVNFKIEDGRIHVPDKFSIGNFDVTRHWVKTKQGQWTQVSGKTDLSYKQIVEAIEHIKKTYSVNDSQIAQLQLRNLSRYLSRATKTPDWIAKLDDKDKKQVIIFLDYLNALMFGVEASGLNAAVLTSAMMLDLISDGKYSYKVAFNANKDGGIYPYACFGNNKGTYTERERIMMLTPPSMRALRNSPALSPVAIKEAIIIKEWLRHAKVLETKLTYSDQLKRIEDAAKDLCTFYFSPWCRHYYIVEKFQKHPGHDYYIDANLAIVPVVRTK